MSDPGPSGKSGGLTKNSSIECTVDDLQEGLLVVSFFHKDNLFQGVLLQLNRERGIPAGISFPKDYFTGERKAEVEQNPSQVLPINQRHTYFQETTNGCTSRSLRRVIKTPARFKNSRISLRPVQRPILCAKCGALCEDKSLPQELSKDGDKPKKNGSNGVTGKKIQANKAPKTEPKSYASNSQASGAEDIKCILPVVDDPQDYSYKSVGNRGIVDNAWKRPLSKPLRTLSSSSSSSSKTCFNNDGKGKSLIKSPSSICSTIVSSTSDKASSHKNSLNIRSVHNNEEESSLDKLTLTQLLESDTLCPRPVFRITRAPTISSDFMTESKDKNKKANALKLCISKLTTAQVTTRSLLDDEEDNVSSASGSGTSNFSSHRIINKEPSVSLMVKAQGKGSKTTIRLRKRNATVPLCTPDQSNIKTRKASSISNYEYSSKTSESDLSSAESSDNPLTCTSNSLEDGNVNQAETVVNLPSGAYSLVSPELSPKLLNVESEFSAPQNSSTSSSSSNNKPSEPTKTPVIKITFGSCGNGVVVQIPPRQTTQQIENTNLLESKAARKAMKKAKKEARKKHSLGGSRESSPSTKIALAPLILQSNISQSDKSESESPPPMLNPELPNLICDDIDLNTGNVEDPSSSEPPRIPKKRKKEKKKKKEHNRTKIYCIHKENDVVKVSGSGGESA